MYGYGLEEDATHKSQIFTNDLTWFECRHRLKLKLAIKDDDKQIYKHNTTQDAICYI